MIRTLRIYLVALLCISVQMKAEAAASANEHFSMGVEAYSQASYSEALEHFKTAEVELEGFALYFNLGNTCYKLNKIPESILYLERALKFEPANDDARYNLRLANERIADRIESLPKTKFALWWEDFRYGVGPDGWAWIAVGLSCAATLLFFLFAFGASQALRRFGFFAGLVCFVLLFAAYSLSSSAEDFRYGEVAAVVFANKVDVKSEPRSESTNVFVLHAGTKVSLLRSEGEWQHIEIASGSKGWIKAEDLAVI